MQYSQGWNKAIEAVLEKHPRTSKSPSPMVEKEHEGGEDKGKEEMAAPPRNNFTLPFIIAWLSALYFYVFIFFLIVSLLGLYYLNLLLLSFVDLALLCSFAIMN